MPVDTDQIMQEAEKLGQLVAQHPAVARYKEAQRAVESDPEAGRMMAEFNHQMDALERQMQAGINPTDAQRQGIESLQNRIVSHLKIKALNLAQVEFVDLLRRVTQTIQRPSADTPAAAAGGAGAGAGAPRGPIM